MTPHSRVEDRMKRNWLLFLSLLILLASLFTHATIALGPLLVTDTLYVGQIGALPRRADPVKAYDTLSGQLIFNVYDTLISMNSELYWDFIPNLATNVPEREEITKTVTSTDVNLTNPTDSTWSDESKCIGWVDKDATNNLNPGDLIYMAEPNGSCRTWYVQTFYSGPSLNVTLWRGLYTFKIHTDPIVCFVNEKGDVVDTFDVYDVEYSFKRGLVQDQLGSPMLMYYEPLFGQVNSDFWATGNALDAMNLAHLIGNVIEVSGDDLIINVGIIFPDRAFKQVLSQHWGSIVSKEFSLSIGCWNGDLFEDTDRNGYPDWFENGSTAVTWWRHISRSPYDIEGRFRWVGTGPYLVTVYDKANNMVKLTRNAKYWRGWPAPGIKNYLETVEIHYISEWTKRKEDFISGNLDICTVPRAYASELLDEQGEPIDPKIKTMKFLNPIFSLDAAFFNLGIDPTSRYVGSGRFPDGIPLNFFNNTHVRRAFAYGFNHTRCLDALWSKEAICRDTPLVYGLVPDYYTRGPDPPYTYDIDYNVAKQELQTAIFNGTSVWDSGFYCQLPYYEGSDKNRAYWEMLRDFFAVLSTYEGRTGPPFRVEPVPYFQWTYDMTDFPMWSVSWIADFADADNYMRPFMHRYGDFSYFQNYTADNGWTTLGPRTGLDKDTLIDFAARTSDNDPSRAIYYADLEDIYITDCPSFPIAQPLGRRWQKYWVRGWYHNPLYPSEYYYHLWKEDTCWADVTGPIPGIPDGVCNIRDIYFIVRCFGAKPPDPSIVPLQHPKWGHGTYGAGCADVYCDRKINIKDLFFACKHFGHTTQP